MKIKIISLFILSLFVIGCASTLPSKNVTLIENGKAHYIGRIDYPSFDAHSGTLTIDFGPNGEKFTGPFVIVNRTAVSTTQGGAVVPLGNQLPAVGSVRSESSGRLDATGFWYAKGDKRSSMKCELQIGLFLAHGQGICKHNNGNQHEILF